MPDQEAVVTKQDLRRLEERIELMHGQVLEAMLILQKEILRAFNNWVSPIEVKMRGHEERLALMEERLRQIERALTDPPSKTGVN